MYTYALLGVQDSHQNYTYTDLSQNGMVYGTESLRLIDQGQSSEFRAEAMATNTSRGWLIKEKKLQ